MIMNENDLYAYFDGEEGITDIDQMEKTISQIIYEGTSCGAFFSFDMLGFTIGSIVEGSDAEFSRSFNFPVDPRDVEDWIEELECLVADAWEDANVIDE